MVDHDTICAVSTPPGEGGIGIIRMSGKDAVPLAALVFRPRMKQRFSVQASHTIHYGHIIDPKSRMVVDEVLLTVMRAPATYTREDVVEINCHGGMMPLRRILSLLIDSGARQAGPGEFTRRAFLNGRIDLAQAEAVMDVISARTDLSLRAANELLSGGLSRELGALRDRLVSLLASVEAGIDFPEEDIETASGRPLTGELAQLRADVAVLIASHRYGRILRDGYATAIVGRPNVGKSSLLNALLKQDRAIVTDIPGTTRDVLEEYLNIGGAPFRILDTAGIRHSHDLVEQEGVRRSLAAMERADIVLVVLDGSVPLAPEDRRVMDEANKKQAIIVVNKSDLPRKLENVDAAGALVNVSCRTGAGLAELKELLSIRVAQNAAPGLEHAWAVNERHKTLLEQAQDALQKAGASASAGMSPEFIALDLRGALDSLGLIIGATHTEDILERIFSSFCIGK